MMETRTLPGRPVHGSAGALLLSSALLSLALMGGSAWAQAPAAAKPPATAPAQAQAPATAQKPTGDPFAALLKREQDRAAELEKDDDLPRAYRHWQVVTYLAPLDATAKSKVATLPGIIKGRAEQYLKDGMANYEAKKYGPAFKSLLKSLAYDPGNQAALRLIKDELIGTSIVPYKVEPGDTLETIAAKNKFEDPSWGFVIPYFNDLKDPSAIKAGMTLKVPVMIGILPRAGRGKPTPDEESEAEMVETTSPTGPVAQAREAMAANRFEDAAKLSAKAVGDNPDSKEAKEVFNAANLGLGKQYADQKNYTAALTALNRVDPNYQDTREAITSVRGQIKTAAEDHYVQGVKFFVVDDLDNAIRQFEITLQMNPGHVQAKKGLQEAKETRDKLKQVK